VKKNLRNDIWLNSYIPINSCGLKSNCDFQSVDNPQAAKDYLGKYITKGEPDANDIT